MQYINKESDVYKNEFERDGETINISWKVGQRYVLSEVIAVLESACTNARTALPYVPIEYNLYPASGRRLHKTTLPLSLSHSRQCTHCKQVHVVYAFTYTLQPDQAAQPTKRVGCSVAVELVDRGNNCYRPVTNARQPAFASYAIGIPLRSTRSPALRLPLLGLAARRLSLSLRDDHYISRLK